MNINKALFFLFIVMFFSGCNSFFYYPSKKEFSSSIGSPSFSPVSLTSTDGVRLDARLYIAPSPVKGLVVQFHGNAQNLTSHFASLYWLTRHGYHLFTFDYRGYGRSESSPSPDGIRRDALAALRKSVEIHQKHSPKGRFIVIGQSLGGVVALRGVQDFEKNNLIDLLVVDSSFDSYQRVAVKKLSSYWITWMLSPLGYVLVSDKTAVDLKKFTHPLLVIHSKNDSIVPFKSGEYIFNHVSSSLKDFWPGEEKGHIQGFDSWERRERFLKWLSENIPMSTKDFLSEI